MPKGVIQIPKETQECKDGKCGHIHEYPFEIAEPKRETSPASFQFEQQTAAQIPPPPQPQNKKLTHEEIAELIPKGINSIKCPGGDCGHKLIKNPKQTKKYKECPHCTANTLPKGSDSCPYCSKEIDEDEELDDGIELEDEDEE